MKKLEEQERIRAAVRAGYGKIAQGKQGGCCGSAAGCGCSSPAADQRLAETVGYQQKDLAQLPDGANMGLSCGNPTALASLKSGEVVLDLGSGGGFDAFIAAPRVGRRGHVIGVDMTPEMIAKARANSVRFRKRTGLANVEFRLGEIEHLPVADSSVDVIISNCVLNLSADKPQVWREMFRVLKPGGRVAVSDLALLRPLPPKIVKMVEALVGCVAGAVLVRETRRMARQAGFTALTLTPKPGYVAAMEEWNDPMYRKIARSLPTRQGISAYVTSLDVAAVKPRGRKQHV